MNKFGIALLFIFISMNMSGESLRIEVDLDEGAGKEVFLANYYLGNIYAKDTIRLNGEGEGVFKVDSVLPQGLYKIYMDKDHHFDFLMGSDQQFSLSNKTFLAEEMKVEGSAETAAFVEYIVFLKNIREEGAGLRQKIKATSGQEKEDLQEQLSGLTNRLHQYWDKVEEEFPGSFLGKFVKANYVPSLDVSTLPPEVQENDSLLLRARFNYQRNHFWDNFDYTDERFLYTPFFKPKLETWFTKVLYQQYDSIRKPVMDFIEEVKPQKRIFQFVASYFLNSSINSKVMGMDALFVDLARKYYLSGEAFWATDETVEKIRENVLFAENNLIGMTAPDLNLESFDGEYFQLHEVDAEYTLLVIYEPNCSHCGVFVPELHSEVYRPFKDKGLEVYAIYSMDDKKEWGDFLAEHELFDWINVWDEHHVSRFKILYDARKTPGVYLLDANKEIVAKKMTVEQIKGFMEREL